jgi:hypothetical protein
MTRTFALRLGGLLTAALMLALPVSAQADQPAKVFSTEQLDQMLAPIALYPDDLLSNVLVGSTYPLEVVQAARWRKESANAKLKGEALEKALEDKDWDPSIKSLALFPDVLQTMSEKLDWTQKLGDAFLAQQDDVMNEIQLLRGKAAEAGNLKTNQQQKITKDAVSNAQPVYIIEPASPKIVYVPVYEPSVVYGSWWYPEYPPYYWSYPGTSFIRGFFWGTGIAIASSVWRWGHFDWHRHNIDIDINRYNRINVNRAKISSNTWAHDPKHRGKVPYRGKEAREKFGKTGDKLGDARSDFRGFDKDKLSDGVKDKLGDGAGQKIKDRVPDGAGQKVKDRAGDRTPQKPKKSVSRDQPAKALDIKKGRDVKQHVDRGKVSRNSAAKHVSARPSPKRGGGGHRGGGRGGGGRRR